MADNATGASLSDEATLKMLERERKANNAWHKLARNKMALVGLAIVVVMVILAIFAPLLAPCDPNATDTGNMFAAPGVGGHLFGTDAYGRDLLSRVIYGARISIFIAIGGTILGAIVGILLGLIAGFFGILGQGTVNVIIAIGVANVPNFARVVRGQVHVVKNEEYCNAERVIGASPARILFKHIFANAMSPVIVYFTLNIASAIISEAALSFLGLGIQPPTASWGSILSEGKSCLQGAPHIATISGMFILVTVLGFNLFGDGIRDVLDPKQKR